MSKEAGVAVSQAPARVGPAGLEVQTTVFGESGVAKHAGHGLDLYLGQSLSA